MLGQIRSDVDQDFQPLVRVVLDPMFVARRSHGSLTGSEHAYLRSDPKGPLPFQHDVDLVLLAVNVTLLFLARLKAVDVAKKNVTFGTDCSFSSCRG